MPNPTKDQWNDASAWRSHAGELRQTIGQLRDQIKVSDDRDTELRGTIRELQKNLDLAGDRVTASRKAANRRSGQLNKVHRLLLAGNVEEAVRMLDIRRQKMDVAEGQMHD